MIKYIMYLRISKYVTLKINLTYNILGTYVYKFYKINSDSRLVTRTYYKYRVDCAALNYTNNIN